jgi:hypothetical protein
VALETSWAQRQIQAEAAEEKFNAPPQMQYCWPLIAERVISGSTLEANFIRIITFALLL